MTHRLKTLAVAILWLYTACLSGCGSSEEAERCYAVYKRSAYGCDLSFRCEGASRTETSYGQPCPPADDPSCVGRNALGHCTLWERPLFAEEATTQPQVSQRISLVSIDLQAMAIQHGDFPDRYSAGEGKKAFNGVLPSELRTEYKFFQEIMYDGASGGNVSIALFDYTQTASETYQLVYKDWLPPGHTQIGGYGVEFEGGMATDIGDGGAIYNLVRVAGEEDNVGLAFQRCRAVVYIWMSNPSRAEGASSDYAVLEVAQTYAQRLDERLRAVTCDQSTETVKDEKPPLVSIGAVVLAASCCGGMVLLTIVVLIVMIRRKRGQSHP